MTKLQYRQGDVLLMACKAVPPDSVLESNREFIMLARGEATGNGHAISSKFAQAYWANNDRFLKVDQPSELLHQEHAAITIQPGIYQVVRQKEYVSAAQFYVRD